MQYIKLLYALQACVKAVDFALKHFQKGLFFSAGRSWLRLAYASIDTSYSMRMLAYSYSVCFPRSCAVHFSECHTRVSAFLSVSVFRTSVLSLVTSHESWHFLSVSGATQSMVFSPPRAVRRAAASLSTVYCLRRIYLSSHSYPAAPSVRH